MEMYSYRYPRPMLTADCVVFGERKDGTQLLLLVRRGGDPYKGMWALPGGFMEMDETLEACARRELQEETGLTDAYIEQFHGRTVTVAFMVEVEECPVKGGDDAREARWFPLDQLPPLAFDHDEIVAAAVARRCGGANTSTYNK